MAAKLRRTAGLYAGSAGEKGHHPVMPNTGSAEDPFALSDLLTQPQALNPGPREIPSLGPQSSI